MAWIWREIRIILYFIQINTVTMKLRKFVFALLCGSILLGFAACNGGEAEADPALVEEIVELETTAAELDSTLQEIKTTESELDAALEDLDLGE